MGKANKLSRKPDWKVGVDNDNDNQVFIKDYCICNLSEVVIEGFEVDMIKKQLEIRTKKYLEQ